MMTLASATRSSASVPRIGSVEHWAIATPDSVALVDEGGQWTWAAWNEAADRLAAALEDMGIGAEDVLAVRARTRKEWALVTAAATKLGGRLLCLNWHLTVDEASYIIRNANVRALICDDEEPELLASAWRDRPGFVAISIDRSAAGFLALAELLETPRRLYQSCAAPRLIVYTSGTTGFPKGVVGGSNTLYTDDVRAEYREDIMSRGNQQPGDVCLVNVPLHHGMGSGLIHRGIECGNKLILMRRFDAEKSLALIAEHKVTFWFAVPTMLQRMANLCPKILKQYDLSSIRSIMTGTAPVPRAMKKWVAEHLGACLTEGYGSTETGMIASLSPDEHLLRPESCGRAYKHVDIKIVDDHGQRLQAGQTGEILVRTPSTITEYLGSGPLGPETKDDTGYFRTGDVGYLDGDGYLFITDRVKDMIIVGGVNIYPAEIEAVLTAHPAVAEAATIGIPNEEYGEEILAFFEAKPGFQTSERELLDFCAGRLASYKRPRRLIEVSELPRNTMGKILKEQLREPFWIGRERRI